MSLRILLVIDDGQTEAERSVARRWWRSISAALVRQGLQVSLATMGNKDAWHGTVASELGSLAVGLSRRHQWDFVTPAAGLARLIRDLRPDIVHAQEVLPTIAAGIASRGTSSLCVYHRHHTFSSGKHELASRLAARLSAYTTVFSRAVAAAAKSADRTPPSRIVHLAAGVPDTSPTSSARLARLRSDLGARPETKIIGTVARLRPEKGIDVAIRGLDRLAREHRLLYVVVGDGPERGALESLASQTKRLVVRFIGHTNEPGLWNRTFDVALVPSTREPFGLVALEAMAAGCPLAAARTGGLEEIVIDGENGRTFTPNDPNALADVVGELVRDVEMAQALARRGRADYELRYTMEAMARSWRDFYEDVAERPSA